MGTRTERRGLDPAIAVVEAIYRQLDAPVDAWLGEIHQATRHAFPGTNIGVTEVDLREDRVFGTVVADPGLLDLHRSVLSLAGIEHDGTPSGMLSALIVGFPDSLRRGLFFSGPVSRFNRTARKIRGPAGPVRPPELVSSLTRSGWDEATNAVGVDPSGRGVVLSVASRGAEPPYRPLACIAGHLAAAHRLRRRRGATEAVLDRGRLVHAEAGAQDDRRALEGAALAMDRARTESAACSDRAALWRALVEGRWSLVERFDSDGRRLMVARRNDPPEVATRALSDLERKVVALFAFGRAQKVIAYELGIGESPVSVLLRSAMRKLGARTRTELVALHGNLVLDHDSAGA